MVIRIIIAESLSAIVTRALSPKLTPEISFTHGHTARLAKPKKEFSFTQFTLSSIFRDMLTGKTARFAKQTGLFRLEKTSRVRSSLKTHCRRQL